MEKVKRTKEEVRAAYKEALRKKQEWIENNNNVTMEEYLKEDTGTDNIFKTDEVGRIVLTKQMKDAVVKAEYDLEEGNCLSESDFKSRFSKWL